MVKLIKTAKDTKEPENTNQWRRADVEWLDHRPGTKLPQWELMISLTDGTVVRAVMQVMTWFHEDAAPRRKVNEYPLCVKKSKPEPEKG